VIITTNDGRRKSSRTLLDVSDPLHLFWDSRIKTATAGIILVKEEMIMDRLKGKRALITGGTSGIGLETAHQFLKEGARVAITGKNPANLETARQLLGSSVLIIPSDAGEVEAQKKVAETLHQAFGELDILFINAGIVELKPLEKWDEAAFDRSFASNVKGPYFLVQALLPIFANPASIVLNTSVNAHIGMPNSSVYAATKAALISLARTLSGELISRGIRANAVSPGPISTPLYGKLGLSEADLKTVAASIQSRVPAGRFGNPSEIAHAIVFLASDESAFTVGSELVIDGGMSNI
jgi:NAD(P)-dependent dehydrogenase (short-subunit alcohol dehydrogenase family)